MSEHMTQKYNFEAERECMYGFLDDEDWAYQIAQIVQDKSFFRADGKHRDMAEAVLSLFSRGDPVNYTHIITELRETGKHHLVDFVNELIAEKPLRTLSEYLEAAIRVQESYVKCWVENQIVQGPELQAVLNSTNGNIDAALAAFEKRVQDARQFVREQGGEKKLWQPKRITDALEPKPPREYVVNGILSIPSLSIFYGPPGNLKTMAIADLALSVANGKPWLPGRPDGDPITPFKTTQAPVLWIDQDSGEDELERRFAAIAKVKGGDASTPFHYVSFPMPAFLADDPQMIDLVIELAGNLKAKLIVIDSLNSVCGNADENSPQMASVMHGLRQLSERCKAAVVAIAHPSKDNYKNLRGHGSIRDKIDLGMSIYRETPEAVDITFEATKVRRSPIKSFGAYFAYTQDKDDPQELETACFYGTGYVLPKLEELKAAEKAKHFIRELAPHKMNQSELIEALKPYKVGSHSIREAINQMAGEGEIFVEQGERNAKLCSLITS